MRTVVSYTRQAVHTVESMPQDLDEISSMAQEWSGQLQRYLSTSSYADQGTLLELRDSIASYAERIDAAVRLMRSKVACARSSLEKARRMAVSHHANRAPNRALTTAWADAEHSLDYMTRVVDQIELSFSGQRDMLLDMAMQYDLPANVEQVAGVAIDKARRTSASRHEEP